MLMSEDTGLTGAERLYRAHGWSGCAGSAWDRLPPAAQDGWRFAAKVEAKVRALRSALAELVDLKDGPRDSLYYERKPAAWEAARAALSDPAAPEAREAGGVVYSHVAHWTIGNDGLLVRRDQPLDGCPPGPCARSVDEATWSPDVEDDHSDERECIAPAIEAVERETGKPEADGTTQGAYAQGLRDAARIARAEADTTGGEGS